MPRRTLDCLRIAGEDGCSLRMSGEESEVLRMAVLHLDDAHGRRDTPELRAAILAAMEAELAGPG